MKSAWYSAESLVVVPISFCSQRSSRFDSVRWLQEEFVRREEESMLQWNRQC